MDPNSSIDRELMYIAKQGLMEPVPAPWEAQRDARDMILYYNTETGQETHQHPCDEAYRLLFKQKRFALLKQRGKDVDESELMNEGEPGDKSGADVSGTQDEPIVSDNLPPASSNMVKHPKAHKGQVTFYPQQQSVTNYEDELHQADMAAVSSNITSQQQFNTSQSGIDPYQYNNYLAAQQHHQRRMMAAGGVAGSGMSAAMPQQYLVGGQPVFPYRSAQYSHPLSGPAFMSNNLSEMSSFALPSYQGPSGAAIHQRSIIDKSQSQYEKAHHARELELKIIRQTLRRSKVEQVDEINKSFKWEMEALR